MAADAVTFVVTGYSATLSTGGPTLGADTLNLVLTGNDVAFRRSVRMVADTGSFALVGNGAAINRNYSMAANAASFSVTGSDVTLTYTPAVANEDLPQGVFLALDFATKRPLGLLSSDLKDI